jgi:hypothetical protein
MGCDKREEIGFQGNGGMWNQEVEQMWQQLSGEVILEAFVGELW